MRMAIRAAFVVTLLAVPAFSQDSVSLVPVPAFGDAKQSVLLGASDGQVWKSFNSNVSTTTTTTTTVPLLFEAPANQGSGVQPGVVSEGFGGFGFGWG